MRSIISSCSSDDGNEPVQMEEDPVEESFTGDYRGIRNSVTPSINYTDFAISAKFVVSASNPNQINAEFFVTSNYTSCCSTNANDGTINAMAILLLILQEMIVMGIT